MDGAIFLHVYAIFQNNFSPIAADGRAWAYVAIFADDDIARDGRQRMHETGFVDYRDVVFEGIDHLILKIKR